LSDCTKNIKRGKAAPFSRHSAIIHSTISNIYPSLLSQNLPSTNMQFTQISIIAFAAFMQAVQADFDLYRIGMSTGGIGDNAEGWQVYPDSWTCDDAIDWIWRDDDDVSGGRYGVRCSGGKGCDRADGSDPSDIDAIEMNFNSDDYHWSEYCPPLFFR
jgi:hypothetical protein